MKVCCFSGTKPQDIVFNYDNNDIQFKRFRALIKGKLEELIVRDHVTHFISGITLGADIFTAEIVLELKKTYPVTLECLLPCAEQADFWGPDERERYLSVLEQADNETLLQDDFTPECYKLFTEYLATKGDYVMAIWDGRPGCTLDTICKAHERGKSVYILNPKLL